MAVTEMKDAQSSPTGPDVSPERPGTRPSSEPGRAPRGATTNGDGARTERAERPNRDDEENRRPPVRRRIIFGIIAVLVVIGIVYGVQYWLHARHFESTDDAFIDAPVVQISSKLPGYVDVVNVDDNQHVTRGQVLVKLDARDQLSQAEQARAALAAAQSRLTESQAQLQMSKADVQQAQAQVDAAKANAQYAHTELARYESMQPGAYSPQEKSNAQAAAQAADANVAAAQSKVNAVQASVATAESHVSTAQAEIAVAHTQVAQAELNLSYTTITAPVNGHITRKSVEPGAYLQGGQALFAIVPDEVWVIANFKETQLTHMQPGMPADITVDAYPQYTFKGHVDSIQAGTGARFSLLPPENATGNYVKVVQRVPVKIVFNQDQKVPENVVLAPGMSVVPDVKVK